jgi:uncharacterized protein (DUF58 family)
MILAALTFYVFATNSQVIWLYLVSALIAALVVVGAIAPLLAVRRLHPRLARFARSGFQPPLAQDRGRVFAGDRLTLVLELGEDRPPVDLGPFRDAAGHSVSATGRIEGREAALAIATGPRGQLQLVSVQLASSWPLGIVRVERSLSLDFSVRVHPRYLLPADDRRHGTREPVGSAAVRGLGDEFLGLREYRSGDSQRRIHWPTSARTGTLMVIETAQESSSSTLYELALGDGTDEAVELAIGIAASLAAGNVATGVPMAMAIPGQPRALRRWGDALAALALAVPGQATPATRGRDALKIAVDGDRVDVRRSTGSQVIDGGLRLEEALEAVRELR